MDKTILAMAQRVLLDQKDNDKYANLGIATDTEFRVVSIKDMVNEISKTLKEALALKAELDAAKNDMRLGGMCESCVSRECNAYKHPCYECVDGSLWKWRGPCSENGEQHE